MSNLNLEQSVFLAKQEIDRLQEFSIIDSVFMNYLKFASKTPGIVAAIKPTAGNTGYAFEVKQGTDGIVSIAPGMIISYNPTDTLFDRGIRIVKFAGISGLSFPAGVSYVIIKPKKVIWEEGTLDINADGSITGYSTNFNVVLRGNGTDEPVTIRFVKVDSVISTDTQITEAVNSGYYEVVALNGQATATQMTVTSDTPIVAEKGLKYIVCGTLPLGQVWSKYAGAGFTWETRPYLYEYDGFDIQAMVSTVSSANNDSTGYTIAKVTNTNGALSIDNLLTNRPYWSM